MIKEENKVLLGIDLGGTKIKSGRVSNGKIENSFQQPVPVNASEEEVLESLYHSIDEVFSSSVKGIGVGVPSVVDDKKGIVYEVQNIPSWKEVHLKTILEQKYGVPVYVNNDVNCFVVGEKHFGVGKPFENFIGLTLGTGLGMGIIIKNSLYTGFNCGAGEIGMIPYKYGIMEEFASGMYFRKNYGMNGKEMNEAAASGDTKALEIFNDFGKALGDAVLSAMYILAPEAIIIGGSVSKAYKYFEESFTRQINQFVFKNQLKEMKLIVSNHSDIAVLGAAALLLDHFKIG